MPPENLVDYAASPEEPSLDAMRYALTQRNATPNQQQRPLDGITDTFKRLAAEFNPLMMGRTLQDAPKILYNAVAAPVAGTWAGALRNVQAAGAAQAYGALGMPQEAAAAQSRVQPVKPQDAQLQLRSNAGQQTQQALGEAFNALQLPPVGPGSGMPGSAPVSPRPFITPNDVRVMGARATHAVREAGQIPTDIANVRNAGIQRMSPLTGQPSVGSRMGSAIEGTSQAAGRVGNVARDVGQSTADYMQMRRDMGLSPVPGVPHEFFPDLRMYAMRPKDSTLVTPSVPPTKDVTALGVGAAPHAAIRDVGAHKPELRTSDALAYLAGMDLDIPRTDAQGFAPIVSTRSDEFRAFVQAKAEELYPNAPSPSDALLAFDEQFSRQTDRDAAHIKLYDEFRESPEGKAVGMDDLPSSTELQERHVAASQWLNSTLLNYAKRKFGAEGDPLVQQASQGFTMLPADDVRRMSESVNEDVLKRRRAQAGMPVAGTLAPAIRDKSVELADATAAVEQLQQRREEYRNVAMQQGLPDPAQLPEYAATTNPLSAAVAKRDKLQDELSNLQLGRDYEKLSDISVTVDTQPNLLGKIEYPQQQFYPSVTRARPDETLFHISRNSALQSTGFNELAAQFYDDVIRGNIPIDKLKGLTVEKYVRGKSESRVAEEKRQAQATAALKTNIESRMQQDMAQYVKPENYFGNVGVLELSTSTGFHIDEIRRLISDDTLVLDHCVAEGPTPGSKAKNLWNGRERRYMPLVDPATGQLLPNSSRTYTRYIREAGDPDANQASMLASVRDKNTGVPVATIELKRSGNGKYSIGYASGYQNGNVKKEYHEAIKEYLNSRADVMHDASSDLGGVGLLDLHSPAALDEAMRILGMPRRESAAALNQAVDSGQLPRFGSSADLRQALTSPPVAQPAVQGLDEAAQLVPRTRLAIDDAFELVERTVEGDSVATGAIVGLEHSLRNRHLHPNATIGDLRLLRTQLLSEIAFLAGHRSAPAADALRNDLLPVVDALLAQPAARPFTTNDLTAWLGDFRGTGLANDITRILSSARRDFPTNEPGYAGVLRDHPVAFAERLVTDADRLGDRELANALRDLANRIAQPAAAQPAVAQPAARQPAARQAAAQQPVTANDLYNYLRDVAQAYGRDEGDAMMHVVRQVRQSFGGAPYEDLLREHPTAFAERIAEFAQEQGNAIVEHELLALADRIAPPVPPAAQLNPLGAWPLAQEMPEAQQPAVQGQAADAVLIPRTRLAIDDAFELAERGLQGDDEATRRFTAFEDDVRRTYLRPNATVSELRMLRSRIEHALEFYTNANPIPELSNALYNDLLPAIDAILEPPVVPVGAPINARVGEGQPVGQQPAPQQPALGLFEEFAIARDLLENARLDNQTFDTGDLGTTLFVLENGNFDDPRFRALGPQSAAAQREVAAALRQMLQEAGIPMPAAQQIAYPGPPVDNQPVNTVRDADRTDLISFIEPDRWPLLNARVDQAAARALAGWPADWQDVHLAEAAGMAEAIRNGQMPDITDGLDVIERELVARDAQQLIEVNARRQGAGVAQQPAARQFDNTPFDDATENFHNALIELADEEGNWGVAIAEVDRVLDDLAHGADSIYGLWEGDEPLTDREREYLATRLRELRQEYEIYAADAEREEGLGDWEPDDDHPANRPQGYKAGGAVRKSAYGSTFALKYANGGTVPQTQSLDAMKYELMMRSK